MSAEFDRKIQETLADTRLQQAIYAATGRFKQARLNVIGADVLPVEVEPALSEQATGSSATLEATEREHILSVVRQTGWVVEGPGGAAKILGLHPNTLRSRMKKLGVTRSGAGRL